MLIALWGLFQSRLPACLVSGSLRNPCRILVIGFANCALGGKKRAKTCGKPTASAPLGAGASAIGWSGAFD